MKTLGRILVISHTSEVHGSTSSLLGYLKENSIAHDYILHPLLGASIPYSGFWNVEADGKELLRRKRTHKVSSVFHYLYHFWLTVSWILGCGRKYDLVLGINNLNAFCGLIFRGLGKANRVGFYSVDYSEKRFDNYFVNEAYCKLDLFCARKCDYVVSVSPRIQAIRERQNVPGIRNLLLPNGVDLKEAASRPREFEGKVKLLFAGHLTRSKGVHLVVEALAKHPDRENMELHIFGDGPYSEELKMQIEKLGLQNSVFMNGRIGNTDLLNKLRDYQVGIALYTLDDDFNYYCDPIKVKEYMAARHAILISDVPWTAEYIEQNGLGIKTENDVDSISKALTEITQRDYLQKVYDAYDNNNLKLDWDDLYNEFFATIQDVGPMSEETSPLLSTLRQSYYSNKSALQYWVSTHPWIYLPYSKLKHGKANATQIVEPESDLVIEGFPRSGNTYARAFFSLSQKDGFKLASHLHSPSHLYLARKYRVPALLLIRNPLDAAVSNMANEPYVHPNQVLKNWIRFYEESIKYKDAFLAVDFETLISDFRGVVEKLNDRFGVGFNTEKINDISQDSIRDAILKFNTLAFGNVNQRNFSFPEADRTHIKEQYKKKFLDESDKGLFNRAMELYDLYGQPDF